MPNRTRWLVCALLAWCAVAAAPSQARAVDVFPAPAGWPALRAERTSQEQLGPGVSYERWSLTSTSGPIAISIATVDLTNPFVTLVAAAQNGVVQGTGVRLSAMADGVHAEAAVNADYFDINGSGAPTNALIINGEVLHQPNGAATFAVGPAGRPIFGPISWRAVLTSAASAPFAVTQINDWSPSTPLTLLTTRLGSTQAYGAEEAVLDPLPERGSYVVSRVYAGLTSLAALAPGEIGVAGHGDGAASIAAAFVPGQRVDIAYNVDPALGTIGMALGGGPLLVRNGALYVDPSPPAPEETNVRYPLTGAGVSADGRTLWLVVADGRRPDISIGLTRPMLGSLFLALGASDAMAFDSGGSSEMVVRRPGDPQVSVATLPSDGRERSIADALAIVNSAPTGPPVRMVLRAATSAVLVGSHLSVRVEAVDANVQPAILDASATSWRIDPSGALVLDTSGEFAARLAGDALLTAENGTISGSVPVKVVPVLAGLAIEGTSAEVPVGKSVRLSIAATDDRGNAVAVDPAAVTWSAGDGASIAQDGTLNAGPVPAVVNVQATAGGLKAAALVNVGDHLALVQPAMSTGPASNAWRFTASSSAVEGGVAVATAPDGGTALGFTFKLPAGGATRAAYALSSVPLPGAPNGLACDVYGDGGGEWLRMSYRNADGIMDSVTLARHVDWTGWQTLRAAVLPQVRWPIVVTRLYVVQPGKDAGSGSLWFRNLEGIYPGP